MRPRRPAGGARALAALAAAAALAGACGDGGAPAPAAPPAPRAAWVIEPTRIALGDVFDLERAVVTPPDHAVRPFRPPETLPGLWLLDSETLPVEKRGGRWLHRTRVRVQARELGRFTWPASTVEIEPPDGELRLLALEPVPLEVVSVLPEHPDRQGPFGVRAPAAPPSPVPALVAAAAGAALALSAVALVAAVRRRRAARAASAAELAPGEPPWTAAQRALAAAQGLAREDPRAAADAGARALRRYAAGRFGADAVARTTEELAGAVAPFIATSRWPALVSLLERLDALRFPLAPSPGADGTRARVAALLAEAQAFVSESTPEETPS